MINDNSIMEVFSAIARVDMTEIKPLECLPAEDTENFAQVSERINADNEQVKAHNEAVNKLKAKISLQVPKEKYEKPEDAESWHYPADPSDYSYWAEKCYIRVQNYKEPEGSVIVEESKPLDKKA